MENPVIIFGASGLGKAALDIFTSKDIVVYCFLDDNEELHNTEINDITVLGSMKDDGFLKYIGKKCEAFVALDDPASKKDIVGLLNLRRKVMPVNAIHNSAIISQHAFLGYGNLVNAGAVVGSGAKLPNHCVIHSNVTIDYEADLEDYVQVGAGSIIGSKVKIESGAMIGAGVTISQGVKIGRNAQVAPGSVVMQNVDANDIVIGNPARSIE
ncbi:MAG: NeuD/PglB/VioB family sugar acetyltransferase [Flammeovirgaceae bacterium]|nr:NeuD/PglB/VioB family sugar acetyltransferase [Flammeovirgaceae bacterium]